MNAERSAEGEPFIVHPSAFIVPSSFPEGSATFSQEKIPVPLAIERGIELVDSDQERGRLVVAAALHLRAGQKVHGPDGLRLLHPFLHNGPEPRLGLGEAAPLIGAERLL